VNVILPLLFPLPVTFRRPFRYIFPDRVSFFNGAVAHVSPLVAGFLRRKLVENGGFLRASAALSVEMVKIAENAVITDMISITLTGAMENVNAENVSEVLSGWFEQMADTLDAFVHNGSGWSLNDVEFMDVTVVSTPPLRGACSLHEIVVDVRRTRRRRRRAQQRRARCGAADAEDGAWVDDNDDDEEGGDGGNRDVRFARDPIHGGLVGFSPRRGRKRESAAAVKNVLLSEREAKDPRLRDCFFLAVARAVVGEEGGRSPSLLHKCIVERFGAYDAARRTVGGPVHMTLKDVGDFEAAVGEELNLAIHVLYQTEDGDIYPLRVSPRSHAVAVANGEASDAARLPEEEPPALLPAPQPVVLLLSYFSSASDDDDDNDGGEAPTGDDVVGHYALVEDPVALLAPRSRDKDGRITHTHSSGHVCLNCFSFFYRDVTYERHIRWCFARGGQAVRMPSEGDTVKFRNRRHQILSRYAIFFDFETYGVPPTEAGAEGEGNGGDPAVALRRRHNGCKCSPRAIARAERRLRGDGGHDDGGDMRDEAEEACLIADGAMKKSQMAPVCPHKTRVVNEQRAYAYSLVVVNREGEVEETRSYAGEDAVLHFLNALFSVEDRYGDLVRPEYAAPIELTRAEMDDILLNATDAYYSTRVARGPLSSATPTSPNTDACQCHICGEAMPPNEMVFDHDHFTGKFVGLAHNRCNMERKEPTRIPVLAHNFSGFDGHLIMREIEHVSAVFASYYVPLGVAGERVHRARAPPPAPTRGRAREGRRRRRPPLAPRGRVGALGVRRRARGNALGSPPGSRAAKCQSRGRALTRGRRRHVPRVRRRKPGAPWGRARPPFVSARVAS
jgi:hypothetical protein